MFQDFRIGVRQLLKRPTSTLVAALCLALGVGANCAIFSYIDALYLRPMSVPNVNRLVRLFGASEQQAHGELSYPEYLDIRRDVPGLAGIAVAQRRGAEYQHDGERDLVSIYGTSPGFFEVMGIRPSLGSTYGSIRGNVLAVMVGYRTWKKEFNADPGIVGRTVRLSRGTPLDVTVVGVLPPEFRDMSPGGDRDFWMPPDTFIALTQGFRGDYENRRDMLFEGFARLAPGVSLEQVRAQLNTVSRRLAQQYPAINQNRRLIAFGDLEWRLKTLGATGAAILGVLFLVLAIACFNVANLLLAAVEGRRREIAIRAAMGASRWRVTRQLLTESVLLAVAGAALAIPISYWLIEAIPHLMPVGATFRETYQIALDSRTLIFAGGIAVLTVVLFGLAPSLVGSRVELTPALKNSAAAVSGSRFPLRNWLAMLQVAASLATLTATGVLVQSFWNRRHGDIGLARKNVLTAWVTSTSDVEPDRSLMEKIRAIPGVKDASIAFRAPMSDNGGGFAQAISIPGHPAFSSGQSPVVTKQNLVDSHYFQLMGIRLLRGRYFSESDNPSGTRVAIISETMARRYWPDRDPVGQFLKMDPKGTLLQIVGVVADAPVNHVGEVREPYFYSSWWQRPMGEYTILAEAKGDAANLGPALRAALKQHDPRLMHIELVTMESLILNESKLYLGIANLVACMGGLALVLTAVGLYGVLGYGVTLRRREIAIRMALGAKQSQALQLVLSQGGRLVLLGIAAGIPLSLAATWSMRTILYGVAPWHLPAFAVGSLVLAVVAFAASWIPARRASRVDPMAVLRYE